MTEWYDQLLEKTERNKASDAEVARLSGMTLEEFDADVTAPDPITGEPEVGEPVEIKVEATWLGTVAGPQDLTRAMRLMCNLERERQGLSILADDDAPVAVTD